TGGSFGFHCERVTGLAVAHRLEGASQTPRGSAVDRVQLKSSFEACLGRFGLQVFEDAPRHREHERKARTFGRVNLPVQHFPGDTHLKSEGDQSKNGQSDQLRGAAAVWHPVYDSKAYRTNRGQEHPLVNIE